MHLSMLDFCKASQTTFNNPGYALTDCINVALKYISQTLQSCFITTYIWFIYTDIHYMKKNELELAIASYFF